MLKKYFHLVDIRSGFKPNKNWAVFLDRDGVINVEKHLVHKIKDFEIYPSAYQAIKLLNKHNIPTVVHNNASVVARGLCGIEQVVKLNEHMKSKFAEKKVFVDIILFCPHHPTAFNKEMVFDCPWRKPKPGILKYVSHNFSINLKKSYVIGDAARDLIMGDKVGAKSILVKTGHGGKDEVYRFKAGIVKKDILEAVKYIIKDKKL